MGFLTSFFRGIRAATPENPRFDLNSNAAWDLLIEGGRSPSGVNVNPFTALTYPALWRGLMLISRDVAKLPLLTYKRVSSSRGEGVTLDKAHAAYNILRHKPNEYTTAFLFKQSLQLHAMLRGNGYAYIIRRGDGTPLELLPLDPDQTYPVRENGQKWFVTSVKFGSDPNRPEQRKLPADSVVHIPGFSYDGFCGLDFVTYAKESLGLGMAASRYASVYFRNNARPSVVLEHPAKLSQQATENLRASWERMHSGLDNAHRIAILQEGMKLNAFGINARDSQLQELRAHEIREVASLIGVPIHKLGDTSRTAYASLEQENQAYLDESLDPWLVAWEEELRDKLLLEAEKDSDSHLIQFDRKALVRANTVDRAGYLRIALGGHPWMSVNEARAEEGQNPDEDPASDTIPRPLNMGGDSSGGPNNQPANPGGTPPGRPAAMDPGAVADVLSDVTYRMAHRIGTNGKSAANNPPVFVGWVDTFVGDHQEIVRQAIRPVERLIGARTGEVADWLLAQLQLEWGALAEKATAKDLSVKAAALAHDLDSRIPAAAVEIFLPKQGD